MKKLFCLMLLYSIINIVHAQQWQTVTNAVTPSALRGGHEANGTVLYIARIKHENGVHIGKARPNSREAFIAYGGKELALSNYEVFTGTGQWVKAAANSFPSNAIAAGYEANGAPLYIARAVIDGGYHPGKARKNGDAFIPYGGVERVVKDYEVLTSNPVATITSGTYHIRSQIGEKPMDVVNGQNANGNGLHLWDFHGGDAQQFTVEPSNEAGYYYIKTKWGRALDIKPPSNASGATLYTWDFHGGDNQKWRFINRGNGYYNIESKYRTYVDVKGGNSAIGTPIHMSDYSIWGNNIAQLWKLERAGSPPTPIKPTSFKPINQRGTSFGMTRNSVPREYNRRNENRNVEANTGRYCTTAIVSEAKGDFEKIVLGNQNDKIFPGAIYFDNAIVEGTYNGPVDLQLQPYDIVTDLFSASSTGSSGIRVNPSLRDVRDGISQLLRRAGSNTRNAANVFLEVNSLNTTEQLAFQLGAGYQGYGVDLEADFNYMKSLSKNVFMAKLVQVYYSVTTNSNVSGRTLIANPSIPSNLIYVSKVNYGRMGYVMISSDASREEIQAALNFRYSGSGNTVSVDARLRYEATMNSMSIKGFFLGGDADRLEIITSPNQLANFTQYVRNGLRVDPNVPPIPVSYEMKYLNDNATAGVRATTTYTERQCEPGKGIRIKLHNVAIEDHHGGDCSYAWGTAKVEVWETNAQRTPIKKIAAAPSLAGDLFWNKPDGGNPLRTTINYATVRGRGAIDQGILNGIGLERVYMLDPKAVSDGRILIRISLNINTNHKDNDFAALGFHGMNRVETRDYWLRDVLVTQDEYNRKKDADYKYGTLQVGKFCSNTDRVHCFYGFFSILNER